MGRGCHPAESELPPKKGVFASDQAAQTPVQKLLFVPPTLG